MKFIKENWFKLSILFLSVVLVLFISNYIWVSTNRIIKKNNFDIFKLWVELGGDSKSSGDVFDLLNEKYGL